MKTLQRKLVRDLLRSKWLLLTITSIVAVGVTCYVSMQSAYHNLDQARQRYYRQCRMADFWIDLKKAPEPALKRIGRLPGISEIQPRIQFLGIADLPAVDRPINVLVLSLPDRRRAVLNQLVLKRGHYFTSRRDNEVIVNEAFARAHGLLPGDWLYVLLNQRRERFFIVGTGISSEFTYLLGPGELVPNPDSFGVVYIKQTHAEDVFDFQGAANQIVGKWDAGADGRQTELLRRVEQSLEPFGVFDVMPREIQPSNQFLTSEIEGLGAFATVVPAIFLAVAALVLNVLINRLARQQRTVVGTLKALGYSDAQIFVHFLSFGLVVGTAGGLAGSLLGYLSSAGMTLVYRQFFEFPDLRSGFYWYTHAVGISISLLCAVAGSLHGARTMLRLRAAEAMRPEPPRSGHAVWLERVLGRLWQRIGSGWRMTIRGIFRARLRTAAGIFAAMMGTGLLVTGFMLQESQSYLIDFQFERILRSDIDVTFADERGWEAIGEVRRLPGIDRAEPVLQVACTFVNGPYRRKGGVTGLVPEAQLTVPRDAQGRRIPLPDHGLVITQRLASILHLRPGDAVTIVPVKGERRPVTARIAHVADSYLGLAAYADLRYLSQRVGEDRVVTGAQLATDRRPENVARLYRQLKQMPGVRSVVARRDTVENLRRTLLETQWVFLGALVLFAGIIFFGSVLNASMVNLAERQREVATFLALGYDQWQVGNMFLRESMTTNLVGTLLGLPVGYLLTLATAAAYNSDLIRLPVVGPPWVWIAALVFAVLFALLAHAAVQWRIARFDFADALKVKE
jgi:putative ABC transport system permease protein